MGIMLRRLRTPFSIRKSLMYSNTRNVETKDRSPHSDSIKQYSGLYFESSSIKGFNFMRLASLVSQGWSLCFRMKPRHSTGVFSLGSEIDYECSIRNAQCSMLNVQVHAGMWFRWTLKIEHWLLSVPRNVQYAILNAQLHINDPLTPRSVNTLTP